MSTLAAATTTPVTNAAKQENHSISVKISVMTPPCAAYWPWPQRLAHSRTEAKRWQSTTGVAWAPAQENATPWAGLTGGL
jgi:hypothetical protein